LHFLAASVHILHAFHSSYFTRFVHREHTRLCLCVCACLRVCSYDQVCTWFSYACRRIIQIPHSCFVSHGSLVIVDIFPSVQMVHQVYSGSYTRGESGYSLPKVAVPPPNKTKFYNGDLWHLVIKYVVAALVPCPVSSRSSCSG